MGYKAKITTLGKTVSRQRKRTEQTAINMLSETSLSPARKRAAVVRIRNASQPLAEARRIVAQAQRDASAGVLEHDGIDFSDVQEIRVRLIRRHGILDRPHANLLCRMDRMIAEGNMSREAFATMAETALEMDTALPANCRHPIAELAMV